MAIDASLYNSTKYQNIKSNSDGTEFLLQFKLQKKKYRKLVRFTKTHGNKTDRTRLAHEALVAYKAEIANIGTNGDVMLMTVNDYFKRTEDASDRSLKVKLKMQQFYDKYIKDSVGGLLIKDVKPTHITSILSNLKSMGFAKSTQKKALECLVPIFKMAIDEDVIAKSPIKKMHNIKRNSNEEKKIILDAETKYRKVYSQIFVTLHHNPKVRALVLLCFYGRRKTEASRLKWDDVDLNNGTYIIRSVNSKVKQDMQFSLPKDVAAILSTLPKVSEYIFYSEHNIKVPVSDIRHHVHKLRDDTGIPELTLHWMRNLAVSALSTMGVDALSLSTMLGHTDPNTLRQYLSMQREQTTQKINEISRKALTS